MSEIEPTTTFVRLDPVGGAEVRDPHGSTASYQPSVASPPLCSVYAGATIDRPYKLAEARYDRQDRTWQIYWYGNSGSRKRDSRRRPEPPIKLSYRDDGWYTGEMVGDDWEWDRTPWDEHSLPSEFWAPLLSYLPRYWASDHTLVHNPPIATTQPTGETVKAMKVWRAAHAVTR